MKRYLPILGVAALLLLGSATTSFGFYDPLVNSMGVEPETDEHPWGGDGLYINNGGNNGGTYIFTPMPFNFVGLTWTFDLIIIFNGNDNSGPIDNKMSDSQVPTGGGDVSTGSATKGKGN